MIIVFFCVSIFHVPFFTDGSSSASTGTRSRVTGFCPTKPGIDHRHMLGLAPIVIAEAGHLPFTVNDDTFARWLRGKKRRAAATTQRPDGSRRYAGQLDELPPARSISACSLRMISLFFDIKISFRMQTIAAHPFNRARTDCQSSLANDRRIFCDRWYSLTTPRTNRGDTKE